MRGRDSLSNNGLWIWVDQTVKWLIEHFDGKGLEFATSVDIQNREVLLTVYKGKTSPPEIIFSVVEKIESFVSSTTVTKIILIAG